MLESRVIYRDRVGCADLIRSLLQVKDFKKRMVSSVKDAAGAAPVEAAIKENLTASLQPTFLKIINESHMHNV